MIIKPPLSYEGWGIKVRRKETSNEMPYCLYLGVVVLSSMFDSMSRHALIIS